MDKLQKYIINNLSILFLSIFLPLFAIASVVFLIKLATYTAIIQLSIWEMIKLYIFMVPELLFYTLPITFFISATLTLFKLSSDNEMVVLFSLGIRPKIILTTLFKPALFLTLLLAMNFLIVIPHSKILSKNFISYKKNEAKFNLSASEYGHSFGEWLLYIGHNNPDGTYGNIFLYNNKKSNEEVLISAKKAEIVNYSGLLRLKLTNGEGYSYSKEKFSQINFETMYINNSTTTNLTKYSTPLEYWRSNERREKKNKNFTINLLLSIFPILGLFLISSIGIVHARQQKGKIYLYMFLSVITYYGSVLGLQSAIKFYTIPLVVSIMFAVSYTIYKKTIVARF